MSLDTTGPARAEWLRHRRTGLGASDVAAVAGVPGAYGSPWSVWVNKVGLVPDEDDNTEYKFGRYAEHMVSAWFEGEFGLHILGAQTWCTKPGEPWVLATVDGFVAESPNSTIDDALGLLEIKTARDSWENGVPLHYQAQAQWQLLATGLPRVWVAAYHRTLGGDPFTVHIVERDEQDIALLYKAAHAFWHDHVLTGIAPEPDGHPATTEALGAAWPDPTEDAVEADEQLAATVALLNVRKIEAKLLDGKVTELENRVKAAIADRTTLTHGADDKGKPRVLATWTAQDRTGFNHRAALDADPSLERFQTTTTSRVLRLKKTRET